MSTNYIPVSTPEEEKALVERLNSTHKLTIEHLTRDPVMSTFEYDIIKYLEINYGYKMYVVFIPNSGKGTLYINTNIVDNPEILKSLRVN